MTNPPALLAAVDVAAPRWVLAPVYVVAALNVRFRRARATRHHHRAWPVFEPLNCIWENQPNS